MVFYAIISVLLALPLALISLLLLLGAIVGWLFPSSRPTGPKPLLGALKLCAIICLCGEALLWFTYRQLNVTVYAKKYSETNFQQLTVGMSEKQVIGLLGEPLNKWYPYQDSRFADKANYLYFVYSKSESGDDYDLRQVGFDDGKVVEIRSYYHVD